MKDPGFRLEEIRGIVLARCDALARVPGVVHAFSTKRGGDDGSFDLGTARTSDARALESRAAFLLAAGIRGGTAAVVAQVHGSRVVRAREALEAPEADAIVWLPGDPDEAVPSVRTADCVPVLLATRDGRAFGAVHAGWRGTAAGVSTRAVEAIVAEGFDASALVAAIGPSIGPCCYEVGADVAELVRASCGGAAVAVRPGDGGCGPRLDLAAANRSQLEAAGVLASAIHVAPWCVRCRGDLFHSYRRDASGAGRMMASIGRSAAGSGRFR